MEMYKYKRPKLGFQRQICKQTATTPVIGGGREPKYIVVLVVKMAYNIVMQYGLENVLEKGGTNIAKL